MMWTYVIGTNQRVFDDEYKDVIYVMVYKNKLLECAYLTNVCYIHLNPSRLLHISDIIYVLLWTIILYC